ncbi:MAG: 4-(cytidine 5'-diphospho)-2-C-methyl-D-erythritol kinase [Coriobacteriia bacterium]
MVVRIFAPAKVNLHLAVGPAADDGYHEVTTVLQALAFGDTVTITPGTAFDFACTPDLGLKPEDNLACRAAMAMAAAFNRPLDVSIAVDKRVPSGAGLGGGSADAAAVILGLARLWGIEEPDAALAKVACGLGADVPFFLTGGAALYRGRGDVLERTLEPLQASLVVVKPAESVPTGQAYAAFDLLGPSASPEPDALISALGSGDLREVTRHLYNNMTPASVGLVPGISGALRLVSENHGVVGAAMAGSGSAVFGICRRPADASACAEEARRAGLWAVATRSHHAGCVVETTA